MIAENFRWYHRHEPRRGTDHVISLCSGHDYLAAGHWTEGEGDLAPIGPARTCALCNGAITLKEVISRPKKLPEAKAKDRHAVAFGRQVRALRKGAGLDQRAAADRLEFTREHLGMIETGKAYPKKATREGILAILRGVRPSVGPEVAPTVGKPAEITA